MGGPKSYAFNSSRMAFGKRGGAIQLRYRAPAEPSGHSLDFRHIGSKPLGEYDLARSAEWGALSRCPPPVPLPPADCLGRLKRSPARGSANAYCRFCRTKGLASGSAARPRSLTTVFRLSLGLAFVGSDRGDQFGGFLHLWFRSECLNRIIGHPVSSALPVGRKARTNPLSICFDCKCLAPTTRGTFLYVAAGSEAPSCSSCWQFLSPWRF